VVNWRDLYRSDQESGAQHLALPVAVRLGAQLEFGRFELGERGSVTGPFICPKPRQAIFGSKIVRLRLSSGRSADSHDPGSFEWKSTDEVPHLVARQEGQHIDTHRRIREQGRGDEDLPDCPKIRVGMRDRIVIMDRPNQGMCPLRLRGSGVVLVERCDTIQDGKRGLTRRRELPWPGGTWKTRCAPVGETQRPPLDS
jgi:hypothetical protein